MLAEQEIKTGISVITMNILFKVVYKENRSNILILPTVLPREAMFSGINLSQKTNRLARLIINVIILRAALELRVNVRKEM